jgi:hypothetical protein
MGGAFKAMDGGDKKALYATVARRRPRMKGFVFKVIIFTINSISYTHPKK